MEAVTFEALVKSYLEIGVLGIIAVVFVLIAIYLIKKMRSDFSWFKGKVDDKDKILNDSYKDFLKIQQKQNEYLIKQIVDQVTQHTPSPKENKKLSDIQNKIDNILKDILIKTGASRACLVQYHNGGRGINKQSFLKMSCTNEQKQIGEKHFISVFQNQFRSVLSYAVNTLENENICYIEDLESIKDIDYGTYDFLTNEDVKQIYMMAIHGEEDMVIGFVFVAYSTQNKNNGNKKLVNEELKQNLNSIELLLSMDVQD